MCFYSNFFIGNDRFTMIQLEQTGHTDHWSVEQTSSCDIKGKVFFYIFNYN